MITSDQLFFEPLTAEHTIEVLKFVQPLGFCAQMGGQTPIELAPFLWEEGFPVIGSSLKSMDNGRRQSAFFCLMRPVRL